MLVPLLCFRSPPSAHLGVSAGVADDMRKATHGSFPIGLISNWPGFKLGSIIIAFLPNDLPN